ncbi:response regulator transcription factor [bacterium]|nr:response regulator transcription factor [bacterium]
MSEKILIVDDEKDFRELISEILKGAGYEVAMAVDGGDALQKLREFAPDAVVLDVNMPVKNGFEVCREIRADPLYGKIPVVFLTVRSEKNSILKGMDIGSDEYITKPFRPKEFVLRIKNILGRK